MAQEPVSRQELIRRRRSSGFVGARRTVPVNEQRLAMVLARLQEGLEAG
ncbi:hypothetical protein [Streptomyces ipomoeae]|nr:hypothetical protein [Streptomyces ipomoeae]MDX2936408.1 hypothetical protein [Streptomyces ipomoeae]